MWNNTDFKKLFIAFTALIFISLKSYASISLYSSQLESLKELLSSFSKAEKNLLFHFTKLKEKNIKPLDLVFQDETFFINKGIVELESYLDDQLESEKIPLDLNKKKLIKDNKIENFINDEDEEINKILNSEFKIDNKDDPEQLVFYDFSNKKKHDSSKIKARNNSRKKNFSSVSEERISSVVKMAIRRELREPIRKDFINLKAAKNLRQTFIDNKFFPRKKILRSLNENFPEAYFDLSFYRLDLDKKKNEKLYNLEFRPHYNKSKRVADSGSGKLEFRENPFNKFSRLAGSIFHHGSMITRISLPLSEGIEKKEIPLIDISSFENYLNKNNLKGIGGSILIDFKDEAPLRVSVDAPFEKRLYLDDDLKVSEFFGGHRFTLFIGVDPGNTLLTFMKSKEKFSEKIIFVEGSEVTYENPDIEAGFIRKVSLFKKNVMGNRKSSFSIDENKIRVFNQPKTLVRKIGLNRYEFKTNLTEKGKREYLRLDYYEKNLYLGFGNETKITIPSRGFIERVLESFNLEGLEKRCLIQVNLKNAPLEVFIDGDSSLGPIDLETRFLDKEGVFESDVENLNELTDQIFILGDLQGTINARINYINGQTDILQTICSADDYLIEQL
ncbi:MAG: hypothetical protein CME68_08395 [Halobacteriovoraceae bacterium]|nr:hypothetical protein [Halobacteriovoraceae bacterium]